MFYNQMEVFMKNKTIQRKFILEFLQQSNNHPSAKEIFIALSPKVHQIGLSTIHRNLKLMEKEKLIRSINFSGCEMRFDKNVKPHLHVICPICGKITDDCNDLYKNILTIIKQNQCATFEIALIRECEICKNGNK